MVSAESSAQRIEKLGINYSYDATSGQSTYSISVDPSQIHQNPRQSRTYLTEIVNAVCNDAANKEGLENLTVSVDEKGLPHLQSVAKRLFERAEEHAYMRENPDQLPISDYATWGGLALGAIAGFIFGYDQTTEFATHSANYLNQGSHLLAPITGLVQTGISLIGTALETFVGAVGGAWIGIGIKHPYLIYKTPLASKVSRYKAFCESLSVAKSPEGNSNPQTD